MRKPGLKEDAKNLSLITGSGLFAVLVTVGLLVAAPRAVRTVRHEAVRPSVERTIVYEAVAGSGINRIYGRVITVDGDELKGYLRWDRNEGSWADLLDADKLSGRANVIAQSGIRFGHVRRIQVLDDQRARFTLRSGETVDLASGSTDLGTELRALLVDDADRGRTDLEWRDLEAVEFMAAPADVRPSNQRLYGTLTTRSGMEFTGYVTWDVDEIYTTDILDGETGRTDVEVPFGAIASIQRHSSAAARVVLKSGEEMVLRGTNDVDESNSGISVSDLALGQVLVDWDEFAGVRFHEPEAEVGYSSFGGGDLIRGTVLTTGGETLSGTIRWDADETYTWEMLDGESGGVEFAIEFGQISSITRVRGGSTVVLKDGRTFELRDSNDVDSGNRGIIITDGGRQVELEWNDFAELRLEG
jgi:hypothetical protein